MSEAPSARPRRGVDFQERVIIGLSVAAIAFLCAQILMFGYGRDQGIYAMVAESIRRGGMPYRDAWDFKPPGVFLVYLLARTLFGPAQVGIRIVEVAGLVAASAGLVRLSERFWGSTSTGFLAAALFALTHAQLDFWHTAQPESFGGMLTIFALVLAAKPFDERAPAAWATFAAGALFGMTGLLKPPLAGGAVVLALYMAHREWHFGAEGLPRRARIVAAVRPVWLLAAGGVTPLVLCAIWFASRGALRDLYQVLFVFTPYYTKLGWAGSSLGGMFYWSFIEWLTVYCSALSIGVLFALGFGATAKEKPFVFLLVGLIGLHLLGVTMQAKFFPYHYGATWPLTALVAAFGFEKLRRRLEAPAATDGIPAPAWRAVGGFVAFIAIVTLSCFGRSSTKDTEDAFMTRCKKRIAIAMGGFRDQVTLDRLATIADVNAGSNREVAALLKARVPEGRTVFVWGFEPVIYDQADRRPASRFLYNVPQRVTWAKKDMRETLLKDLAATHPAAIVVEHRDVFPMVTGDAIDSADTLYDFWDFYVFLQDYKLETKVGDLDVYFEKEPPPAK